MGEVMRIYALRVYAAAISFSALHILCSISQGPVPSVLAMEIYRALPGCFNGP